MRKFETVLYTGTDETVAMTMYNLLINHRTYDIPIRVTDEEFKIDNKNVHIVDVAVNNHDQQYTVSVTYKHKWRD